MSELNLATISDIHLLHKRTPTREIVKNLREAFPDNAETAKLNIIVLVGDVFDDLGMLNDDDLIDIDMWITDFLRICKKHDIIVFVLDGTKSHDWYQSKRFVTINEIAKIGANLTYVKDLSILYEPVNDLHCLFVPDEWDPSTEKTLSQVHELLRAKGLTQVDYAFMHGQFEYQLPEHITAPKHSSAAYHAIVRELIFIGHIHTHSIYGRIIAQGSFDRLAHGEEEPKGHVRATIRDNGDRDIVFVENVNAKRYVTVDCKGLNLDETIAAIDAKVGNLPDNSHVRVEGYPDNPIFESMETLIRRYPVFHWTKLSKDIKDTTEVTIEEEMTFTPITINRDNVSELLMERIAGHVSSGDVMEAAAVILKGVI